MKKKEIVDFITNLSLILLSCVILVLPIFHIDNLKAVLIAIFSFYTVIKLTQFAFIFKEQDYQSLFTSAISLGALLAIIFIPDKIKFLALVFLIWFSFMSLVKLKKADFYDDRKNKMWILRLFTLFLFLICGLLVGINLYCGTSTQIILVGFFFLINGVLEAIDPIVIYLMEAKNEK